MRSTVRSEAERSRRGGDGGASLLEYVGTIVLAAVILAALWSVGIGPAMAKALPPALCTILQTQKKCAGAPKKLAAGSPRPSGTPSPSSSRPINTHLTSKVTKKNVGAKQQDQVCPQSYSGQITCAAKIMLVLWIAEYASKDPAVDVAAFAKVTGQEAPNAKGLSEQEYFDRVVDVETAGISKIARNGGQVDGSDFSNSPAIKAYNNGVAWANRDAMRRRVDPSATQQDHAGQVAVRNYVLKHNTSWIKRAWQEANHAS